MIAQDNIFVKYALIDQARDLGGVDVAVNMGSHAVDGDDTYGGI